MATNEFLPFCEIDDTTNLMSQSAYLASSDRTSGKKQGLASRQLDNKAIRQSSAITSQIAQYMFEKLAVDILDDGSSANMLVNIRKAFGQKKYVSKATSYALDVVLDDIVAFSAVATATLPTAVGFTGRTFVIVNSVGGYNVTVATTSSQTIGGFASSAIILSLVNSFIIVVSDGANWQLIGSAPTLRSVMTTGGDIIYGGAAGIGTRLANGSNGQVLTSAGGTNAPTCATPTAPPVAATQGDQETATSTTTFVSPARQQFHPSAAKAWVNFNGTGTVSIRLSYGVTSLTDNSAGNYTIAFSTNFSSATESVMGSSLDNGSGVGSLLILVSVSVSGVQVLTITPPTLSPADSSVVTLAAFGDQ